MLVYCNLGGEALEALHSFVHVENGVLRAGSSAEDSWFLVGFLPDDHEVFREETEDILQILFLLWSISE